MSEHSIKNNKTEKMLRKEIFENVKELQLLRNSSKSDFIPGISYVNYAGRIYDEQELMNLVDASLDFWLTTGRYNDEFEKRLAEFLNVKFAMTTNSGSSANLLAISALTSPKLRDKRLLPGDEVITTACGFPTTLNPIIQNNLTPVFVDVKLGAYNIDEDKIEQASNYK